MNEHPPQDNQPPQEPQQPFNEPQQQSYPQQPYPQQPYPQQPYPQWQPQQQPPTQYPPNYPPSYQPTYPPNYQPPYPPYAPPPVPPPKKKRGPLFWILVVLGVVLVIGVCSAVMNAASHSTPSATIQATATPDIAATNVAKTQATQNAATPIINTTTTPNPSQSDTYPNGDYKVGKTAQVDSWSVTVNSAKTSYGGPYDTLKPGNIFLVVDVTVKNGTGSSQNVSSALNFKLNDSTGQGYNETFMTGAKAPDDTALRDGAKLRGQLVYEVPKSMKHFTFVYQPNFLSNDQAVWDINL
jgi:hypothetical protein